MSITRRALLIGGMILATAMPALAEFSVTPYSADVLAAAKASGKPYLLDYFAPWCSTCRAQERVVSNLVNSSDKYDAIKIIRVDWDTYRSQPIAKQNGVTNRSTLILFNGDVELGRLEWDARKSVIQGLLDKGV